MKNTKSPLLQTLPQYYFDRGKMVVMFATFAPLFDDYRWEQGSFFSTDYFYYFRDEDEFYLLHKPSGTVINWYKHLGRTNTCNKNLNDDDLRELLEMLNDDILYLTDRTAWNEIHKDEIED